ncbi:hypothetical protein [Bdellovibrio sp. HCB337]|uniref:hypothetical protein n=1 Tax=Bdellovibrio sp. HCB337 TaxID=3394358 RepID=UPI0039A55DCA
MKKTMSLTTLTALLLIASGSYAAPTAETEQASASLGAAKVSEVSFEAGKATLTKEAQDEIRTTIQDAMKQGKIGEVKAAVWADREYPVEENKAPKQDVKLASDRADALKKFIKDELKVKDVNTYNMAERPNALEKFVNTSDAKVKTAMEGSGAAPKTEKEKGLFNQKAQASKAVIMIYVK